MDTMLGKVLRDKISGVQGIATVRTDELNGNVRYQIELDAPGDKLKLGELVDLDAVRYEVVGDGPYAPIPCPEFPHLSLGLKVRDKFSGMTGYISATFTSMSGCIHFYVVSDKLDKDGKLVGAGLDGLRLEPVEGAAPVDLPKTKTGSSLQRTPIHARR